MDLIKNTRWSWIVRGALFVGAMMIFAILFPVFAQSKGGPRKDMGLSNLKQILTASAIYCSDYNDLLPPMGHWESAQPNSGPWIKGDQMAWREALDPYTKNKLLFFHRAWPFKEKEGARLELVRGVTNGASCYGYVDEIATKWFGDARGVLTLSPVALPPEYLKAAGGSQSEGPLIEDLAWKGKGWFGRDEEKRITDSFRKGYRILGMTDTAAKFSRLERSES